MLEYRFPAYTGLPPRKVDRRRHRRDPRHRGRAARSSPTMATPGGRDAARTRRRRAPLTRQADGTLTGSFKIDEQGFYRIELDGPQGEKVERVAAVHDRRHRRSARRRSASPSRGATRRRPRSKKCSPRRAPTTTSASSSCSCSTRSTAAPEKTINLFGGAKPLHRSHAPATRSTSRSSGSSRATSCPTTRRRPTTTRVAGRARRRRATSTSCRSGRSSKDYKPAQSQARRRRRRRRRRPAGRPALAAAARDRRGDVQRRPRQGRR